MKEHGEEETLVGLDYTTKQLFWIFNAQIHCKYEALEEQKEFGDPDSSGASVNGVLSNSPEFARDFNCPDGSPMISQDRCHLW